MIDQLNGKLFDRGPKPFLHAPHLKNLTENLVCFSTCWTASPLCAPGRASFMSGQLPSRTKVYDNAASAPPVFMEYAAEGSTAPLVGIHDGDFKFIHCSVDPPQLFDLASDPDEMQNLPGDPAYADRIVHLTTLMKTRWDLERFDAEVRELQARSHVVYAGLRQGHYYPWDYQPLQLASERYMRNHMDLNILEETKRFPRGE